MSARPPYDRMSRPQGASTIGMPVVTAAIRRSGPGSRLPLNRCSITPPMQMSSTPWKAPSAIISSIARSPLPWAWQTIGVKPASSSMPMRGLHRHLAEAERRDRDAGLVEADVGALRHLHHAADGADRVDDLRLQQRVHLDDVEHRVVHGDVVRADVLVDVGRVRRHRRGHQLGHAERQPLHDRGGHQRRRAAADADDAVHALLLDQVGDDGRGAVDLVVAWPGRGRCGTSRAPPRSPGRRARATSSVRDVAGEGRRLLHAEVEQDRLDAAAARSGP